MRFPAVRNQFKTVFWLLLALMLGYGIQPVKAMHIIEGFLPPLWAAFWFAVAVLFWVIGFIQVKRLMTLKPETRLMLGLAGAFTFVLSALKLPGVTGSSSHPTGTDLGAILFGPFPMSILGSIVLLFQALLLAHGGLTTLGANSVSIAVVGPLMAWAIWKRLKGKLPDAWVVITPPGFSLSLDHPAAR